MSSAAIGQSEQFAERFARALDEASMLLLVSLGHRTGLFDLMGSRGPTSCEDLAAGAGLDERYVREWLGGMVCADVVELDEASRLFRLPEENADVLLRSGPQGHLLARAQWVGLLGAAEDRVAEAFRHGEGVPASAFPRFDEVMAEESRNTVVEALATHILPLVPGLTERLRRGIEVLDAGCGEGGVLLALAERFPESRFLGYDHSAEAVFRAQRQARARDLENLRFEVRDICELPAEARFDLITAFDVVHDQAHPARMLGELRRALRRGGHFLMQDLAGSTQPQQNRGGSGRTLLYALSCMHAMSVALAQGGAHDGAIWGEERAAKLLREAGFEELRKERFERDALHVYYVAR
jgi:SAM-dependent methyltransferase